MTPRLMRQADAARKLGIARASMHYHIGAGNLEVVAVAGVRFVTRASVDRLARTPRQRDRTPKRAV